MHNRSLPLQFEFIPAARKSRELLIVLHGKGDQLKPFRHLHDELGLPDLNLLLLNAPKKFLDGYSWYGDPPYLTQGVLRIRQKLFELLLQLESYGWQMEDIYFLGFSQGALVSCDLAMHFPRKLAGVIGVSGYFHFYPRWQKLMRDSGISQTPFLLTHGFEDDVLPYADTRFGVEQLRQQGWDIEFHSLEKKHEFVEDDFLIISKWIRIQRRLRSMRKQDSKYLDSTGRLKSAIL